MLRKEKPKPNLSIQVNVLVHGDPSIVKNYKITIPFFSKNIDKNPKPIRTVRIRSSHTQTQIQSVYSSSYTNESSKRKIQNHPRPTSKSSH